MADGGKLTPQLQEVHQAWHLFHSCLLSQPKFDTSLLVQFLQQEQMKAQIQQTVAKVTETCFAKRCTSVHL